MNHHYRYWTAILLLCLFFSIKGRAQVSPDPYVPCQEMPQLIENYRADAQAIIRFYTSSYYGTRFRGNGGAEGGSPEKRARLEVLDNEYLQRLDQLDFNGLPQECKVDYILFRRDLKERMRLSVVESTRYAKIKAWLPFSDSIYAL